MNSRIHIDYTNSIMYGITYLELQKMERIQKMCAKPVLHKVLHRLERTALVASTTYFKILSILYKCRNGFDPKYLADLPYENPVKHTE